MRHYERFHNRMAQFLNTHIDTNTNKKTQNTKIQNLYKIQKRRRDLICTKYFS